ncbi:hypothetical protein Vadar_020949 [Vaccinium darrowii]|uniref:Uncharacterized protein n=1 Tax=Vaccinium darrowii TaxID=229202 RepID=A0ACB7YXA4_9ERIC|nr:hypothetical protein Vadar_020949 [Vaccinium darrowii]
MTSSKFESTAYVLLSSAYLGFNIYRFSNVLGTFFDAMEQVDKQGFDGGWIPLTHKHTCHGGNFKSGKQPLITLFVDNLPEDTSQPWLKMMFNKYGVVKEVFIPEKRSKATGTRPVSSNSNREGVICQTGLGLTKEQGSRANVVVQNHTFLQNSNGFSAKPSVSYSEALRGGTNVNGYSKIKSVIVAEVTDSWLQRSAIGKLKSFQSIKTVHKLFFDKGFKIAQIKSMGGLNLVVTFHSKELLDSLLAEENLFFSNWFIGRCRGPSTQKSLAFDRGRVMVAMDIMDRIDEVINLSINGALVKIRVIEDRPSYFTSTDNYSFWDEIGNQKTVHSETVDEADDMAPELYKLTHAEDCKINSQAEVNAHKDGTDTDTKKSAIREDVSAVGETPINNEKAPSDVTPLFVDLDSGLPIAGKGRKKRNKCVLVRSAIAAAALCISSERIKNRNRIILNEEETVRTIAKIMSEDFMGNDEEVLSNFMALE